MNSTNILFRDTKTEQNILPSYSSYPVTSIIIILLVITLFIGVGINIKVLCTVRSLPKQRNRKPAIRLLSHLSSTAIVYAFLYAVIMSSKAKVLTRMDPVMCNMTSFLHSFILGVFSLNVAALVHDHFRVLKRFNRPKLSANQNLIIIWLVSGTVNLPSLLMKEYVPGADLETGSGKCLSVWLLGKYWLTVLYEVFRFAVFHLSVVIYMIYAMYEILDQIKKLHRRDLNLKMQRKLQSLNLIYSHFITFIVIWLPYGVLYMWYRLIDRDHNIKSVLKLVIASVLGVLVTVYLLINPAVYLYLMERKKMQCCFSSGHWINGSVDRFGDHQEEHIEMENLGQPRNIGGNNEQSISLEETFEFNGNPKSESA